MELKGADLDGQYQVEEQSDERVVLTPAGSPSDDKRTLRLWLSEKCGWGTTWDDQGRRRVARDDRRTPLDFLLPRRHGKWWNWNGDEGRTQTFGEIYRSLKITEPGVQEQDPSAKAKTDNAKSKYEHVEAIAQTAVDRAAAADRRAATIAGTVAIAASFTLGGAAVVMDASKFLDNSLRSAAAVSLGVSATFFAVSAMFALWALVAARQWNWSDPHALIKHADASEAKRVGKHAASLLKKFGANWEISDHKNRLVDQALKALLVALIGVVVTATLITIDAVDRPDPKRPDRPSPSGQGTAR